MNKFHFLDWGIILTYFIGLIWIGIIRQKNKSTSQNDFILSGRRLSLTGFVATLVTTWYGAILGIGENTFLYGIQTWFIFSLPYYLFAIGYAFWIAPKIRKKGLLSIRKLRIATPEIFLRPCKSLVEISEELWVEQHFLFIGLTSFE